MTTFNKQKCVQIALNCNTNLIPSLKISDAGYGLLGLAVIQVPIWAIYELFRVPKPSFGGKLKGVFKPTDNWGPKNPRIKAEWMKEVIRREVDEVLK